MRNVFARGIGVLMIMLMLCTTAYSVTMPWNKSDEQKAREASDVKTKSVEQKPFSGLKWRVAVLDFEEKVPAGAWRIGSGMADMLTTSLMDTGRFRVYERQQLSGLLAEQNLGAAGRVTPQSAAQIGKLLGVQLLVYGAVTEFTQEQGGQGGGISYKGISVGGKRDNAHVAIDMRIMDTATGEVIASQTIEGKPKGGGLAVSIARGDFAFGGDQFNKTPIGEATRSVINDAVNMIQSKFADKPWYSVVIKNEEGKVYIRGGTDSGVTTGMTFAGSRKGKGLVDPETGETLGATETKIGGTITVTEVDEKFSIATATGDAKNLKEGDLVRRVQ